MTDTLLLPPPPPPSLHACLVYEPVNPKTNVKVIIAFFHYSKNSNVGSIFANLRLYQILAVGTSAVGRVTFFANASGNLMCRVSIRLWGHRSHAN